MPLISLKELVDRVPDREAIVHGSTRLTYKELDARSNKAANALKKLGIKKEVILGYMPLIVWSG